MAIAAGKRPRFLKTSLPSAAAVKPPETMVSAIRANVAAPARGSVMTRQHRMITATGAAMAPMIPEATR